jgi:hypothetical protein
MYLNDRIGDCTCATAGHIIQALSTYGKKTTETITDNDVLAAYTAVSGYNPITGEHDDGAVVQEVLSHWRKVGIGGHKILAFASVDFRNPSELRQATHIFGNVYLGIDFPNTAMDQFNNGEPWDVVDGAYSEGGHAINAGYYDVSDGMWKVVTWGKVQPMTQAFWDKYVEEAWVVVSPEWLDATGRNPEGIDMTAMGDEFTKITGEASPFPASPPAPAPVVNPTDEAFIKVAKAWLSSKPFFYKSFQKKLQAWVDSK